MSYSSLPSQRNVGGAFLEEEIVQIHHNVLQPHSDKAFNQTSDKNTGSCVIRRQILGPAMCWNI